MGADRENNGLYPAEYDQRSETFFICSPKTHNSSGFTCYCFLKFSCSLRVCRNICHLISSVDDTRQMKKVIGHDLN